MNIQVYDKPPEDSNLFFGYTPELNELRNSIDDISYETWKTVRWIINDYDFLVKTPIINRAFYKYWEIINRFQLQEVDNNKDIVIHLAEAPGGFIQVSQKIFGKNKNKKKIIKDEDGYKKIVKEYTSDKKNIYSMSLNKDIDEYKKYNLPSYNENIITNNVVISYGEDNTGNLLNLNNIHFLERMVKDANRNVKIITADGGFDEGNDFNNKEQLHYSLILHEILAMLILSNRGTHFVLKMYDTYTKTSVDTLYLLHKIFETVNIFKPVTSRPTNSEKYIICKNLKISDNDKLIIIEQLKQLNEKIKDKKDGTYYFTLFNNLPDTFIKYIVKINENVMNNQCINLKHALYYSNLTKEQLKNFLDSNKESLKVKKEKAFKEWSTKYNFI